MRRAEEAAGDGRFEDALELASLILGEEPGHQQARELVAKLRTEISQRHRRRDTAEVLLEEAQILDRGGQYDKALETLATILLLDAGYGPAIDLKQRIEAQMAKNRPRGSRSLRRWLMAGGTVSLLALAIWNFVPESGPALEPPAVTTAPATEVELDPEESPPVLDVDPPERVRVVTTVPRPTEEEPSPLAATTAPPHEARPPETTPTAPLVAAEREPLVAEPEPEPPPPPVSTARLSISTTPAARLMLDGTARGITPMSLEIEPGVHQVVLTAADGFRWEERVELTAGVTTTLSRGMSAFGSLSVTSPIWVDVSLDGNPTRQTPLFFGRVPVGNHTVVISRPGYKSQVHSTTIEEGQSTSLSIELVRER